MSNYKCPECGMINIDCVKGVYKTPREIELEQALEAIKEYTREQFCDNCEDIGSTE